MGLLALSDDLNYRMFCFAMTAALLCVAGHRGTDRTSGEVGAAAFAAGSSLVSVMPRPDPSGRN
jgi:hypothetical protein